MMAPCSMSDNFRFPRFSSLHFVLSEHVKSVHTGTNMARAHLEQDHVGHTGYNRELTAGLRTDEGTVDNLNVEQCVMQSLEEVRVGLRVGRWLWWQPIVTDCVHVS